MRKASRGGASGARAARGTHGRGIGKRRHHEHQSSAAAPFLSHFAEATESEERVAEQLLGLARECIGEAAGARLELSELGSAVQARAPMELRPEINGKTLTISKYMKARFGGWEAFIRDRGAGALVVVDGAVCRPPKSAPAAPRRSQAVDCSIDDAIDSLGQLGAG